ncbi:hypothetical protein [Mycobacterium sp. MS1601]|uniref:hypothetical protein n=1 Tax=Mycobacterium sp. MS1601 TaxID=1936029 RepID=UPI001F48972D|nr:hypothetical protein [Mycobacterium sp. MS1601]
MFAVATVPDVGPPAVAANVLCFVGSWFFTTAGWMQLALANSTRRAEWFCAATQFAGTLLFNVSTGAAVWATAVSTERRFVWAPDAGGSVAFLVSGGLGLVALTAVFSREGLAAWVNMAGCVAFGVSALGAFVFTTGSTENATAADLGTFLGALCFLVAALLVLPGRGRRT